MAQAVPRFMALGILLEKKLGIKVNWQHYADGYADNVHKAKSKVKKEQGDNEQDHDQDQDQDHEQEDEDEDEAPVQQQEVEDDRCFFVKTTKESRSACSLALVLGRRMEELTELILNSSAQLDIKLRESAAANQRKSDICNQLGGLSMASRRLRKQIQKLDAVHQAALLHTLELEAEAIDAEDSRLQLESEEVEELCEELDSALASMHTSHKKLEEDYVFCKTLTEVLRK